MDQLDSDSDSDVGTSPTWTSVDSISWTWSGLSRVRPQYNTVPEVEWWNWRVLYESCQAQSCYVPETERNTGTSPKNIFNISVVDLVSFVNEVPEIVPETKFYVFVKPVLVT